jgi:hypothetical protein
MLQHFGYDLREIERSHFRHADRGDCDDYRSGKRAIFVATFREQE